MDWWKKDSDYTEGIVKMVNELNLPFFITYTSSSAYTQGFCWVSAKHLYMKRQNYAVSPIFPTAKEALVDLFREIGEAL
jgi:hypothetical protein